MDIENFLAALEIAGSCALGIAGVAVLLMAVTALLNKMCKED